MRKIYFYLPIILLFLSCDDSEEVKINFNDQLEVNDLLSQNKYQKLYKDEDYKDYINEVFENKVEMHSIVIKGSEMMAESNLVDDKIGSDMSVDLFFSGMKGAGSMAMKGYTMMGLESDKEELYASFSNSKIALADEFEDKIIEILEVSNVAPKNHEVESTDRLLNYKSYDSEIKNDDRLRDNLSDLTDEVDELFELGYKIRIQQNLNIALGNEIDDFSKVTDLGLKILEGNGNYPIDVDSDMLDKYFESVNDILEEINHIESNLSIPVEDWSQNKRLNYQFVIEDIKIKLKEDILNFKIDTTKNVEIISDGNQVSNSKDDYLKKLNESSETKFKSKDYIGLVEDYNEALTLYPKNGKLYESRGLIKEFLKDYAGALEDYDRAKELLPDDYYMIYLRRATTNVRLGNIPAVLMDCNAFLSSNPQDIQNKSVALFYRALAKLELENYQEAIVDLNNVIDLQGNKNELLAHMHRGRAKYFLQDYNGSMEDYNIAIERNSNIPLIYIQRARTKEHLEDYNGAIIDYNKAIELSPNEADLFSKRAKAHMDMTNYKIAISDCDKALELDPQNGDTYLLRGKAKMAIGENDEACKDFHLAKEFGESEGTADYAILEFCGDNEVY